MNTLEHYDFTINDFEKTTIHTGYEYLKYRTEIISINEVNQRLVFNVKYTIIDNWSFDYYEPRDNEVKNKLKKLKDNNIHCPQIVGTADFSISPRMLVRSYTIDGLDIPEDDTDVVYDIIDVFIGNEFDVNDTSRAIKLVGKSFISDYLNWATENWDLNTNKVEDSSLFRFGHGVCGIQFSEDFLRNHKSDLLTK